jgi:thiamine biosynthesis protein ThiS
VRIEVNGESQEVSDHLTVTQLLDQLAIDARRVAVEHNLVVLKRAAFDATVLAEGDQIEIVNFVGGGQPRTSSAGAPDPSCDHD